MKKYLLLSLLPMLMLAMPPSGLAASPDQAWIITQVSKPANCISKVRINNINGKERRLPPQGFKLDPGQYTMTGTALLDTTFCPVTRGNQRDRVQPLEAEFEAGKKYYVGLDHSASDRKEWALVVWKIEEYGGD